MAKKMDRPNPYYVEGRKEAQAKESWNVEFVINPAEGTVAERNRAVSAFFVVMRKDIPDPYQLQTVRIDPISGEPRLFGQWGGSGSRPTQFKNIDDYNDYIKFWGDGKSPGTYETVLRDTIALWEPKFATLEEANAFWWDGDALTATAKTLLYNAVMLISKGKKDQLIKKGVKSTADSGFINAPGKQPQSDEPAEEVPVPQRGSKDWEDLPQSQVKAPDDISLGDVLGKIAQDNSEDK